MTTENKYKETQDKAISNLVLVLKDLANSDKSFITSGSDNGKSVTDLHTDDVSDLADGAFTQVDNCRPLRTVSAKEAYDFVLASNMYSDLYNRTRDQYYKDVKEDNFKEAKNMENYFDYIHTVLTNWIS
jgi:hypothetical protein